MDKTNFTLDEIRQDCLESENQILDLYLERKKQKEICESLGINRGKIDSLVKKYKLTRFRDRANFTVNESSLTISNVNIWYYLGVFASDGSLTTAKSGTQIIQFTMDDLDVLEHIKEILGYTGEIKNYFKQGKTRYFLAMSNKALIQFTNTIFSSDCHRKTDFIEFPKIPNEGCLIMFLRGFIDGDGSFRTSRNESFYRFAIYCKSKQFILKLKECIDNIIGKPCSFYNNSTIEISSQEGNYKLFKFLYEKIDNKYYMKRKYERAKQHIIAYEAQ